MTAVATGVGAWAGLTGESASRAAATILEVAARLADPHEVAAVAGRPDNVDPIYGARLWEPMALSHGHPGIALLHGELARRDPAWAAAAHAHLTAAMHLMPASPSNGLYYGPAAVAAAAQTCAGSAGHYARLRRHLLTWVAQDQLNRLNPWTQRRGANTPGVGWGAYDVINGISGTGRLLLDATDDPDEGSHAVDTALDASLRHLTALTAPVRVDGHTVPGWWVPADLQPVDDDRRTYPRGDFNLGLAHGAPGPLMLLTLAAERGRTVPGQLEAIHTLGSWLRSWTLEDDAGPYWPARVGWDHQISPTRPQTLFTRSAWCYGAPGVAAALHRAGTLLGLPDWRDTALRSLRAVLARDTGQWRLDGPTVCHGLAGLLQVLHQVGTNSEDQVLLAGARTVAGMVLDWADPRAPFVFQHQVPDSPRGWQDASATRSLNIAGMLEGAAGTACALLAVTPPNLLGTTHTAAGRPWNRTLMLA